MRCCLVLREAVEEHKVTGAVRCAWAREMRRAIAISCRGNARYLLATADLVVRRCVGPPPSCSLSEGEAR